MASRTVSWQPVEIARVRDGRRTLEIDRAATEAPLEVRLHGESFVVTMRTPGADRDLTAGFLLSEGVISHREELDDIVQLDEDVVDVVLRGAAAAALPQRLARRRQVTATSACGVCGRASADALATIAAPIDAAWTISASVLTTMPAALRARQAVFDQTGGLHAAGVFTTGGTLVESAEDVGRHNAVDKALGRLLLAGALPLSTHVLCVSGRASFELVQKAVVAGIPMLVAVSAPSSLAIELARERNVTLAGFVRGETFNIYTHDRRIA